MEVRSVRNSVAKINPDAEANRSIACPILVIAGNMLLHFRGTADRPINAVEHDQQRVAPGLNDPAAMFFDRRID
jgi:hypothetical protein